MYLRLVINAIRWRSLRLALWVLAYEKSERG